MGILAFFAVYNFITTEVVNVYENNSEALLRAYEDYAEFFFEDRVIGTAEAGHSVLAPYQISLPSNSFCARDAFRKQLYGAHPRNHKPHTQTHTYPAWADHHCNAQFRLRWCSDAACGLVITKAALLQVRCPHRSQRRP